MPPDPTVMYVYYTVQKILSENIVPCVSIEQLYRAFDEQPYLKCMCIKKFSCKKTLLFERTLEIIYTNSLQLFHILLRSWDIKICLICKYPRYDIKLHNELLKTPVYLWDYETKSLKMMHVHGCIPQHQPCKSSSDLIWW